MHSIFQNEIYKPISVMNECTCWIFHHFFFFSICINNGTNRALICIVSTVSTVIVLRFIMYIFDHILRCTFIHEAWSSQLSLLLYWWEMQRAFIVSCSWRGCYWCCRRGRKKSKFLILLNTDKWKKLKINCSNTVWCSCTIKCMFALAHTTYPHLLLARPPACLH